MKRIILILVSMAITLTFFNLVNIKYSLLNESTFKSISRPGYDILMDTFIKDYVQNLSGILSESEIIAGFKNAYPEETFQKKITPIIKSIVAFLKGEVDYITRDKLDVMDLKSGLAGFFDNEAKKAKNPQHKKELTKLAESIKAYPDSIDGEFIVRQDDVERLEEVKPQIQRLGTGIILLGILFVLVVLLLIFNLPVFGIVLALSGVLGLAISFLPIASYLPQNIDEITLAIAKTTIKRAFYLLSVESGIMFVVGVVLMFFGKKK
ncbi:MAG TPA: hypothetical protein VII00_05505 [bacterium]